MKFKLEEICIVEHQVLLFLIGADILKGGYTNDWNFTGFRYCTLGKGKVRRSLEFSHEKWTTTINNLVHCLVAGSK